MTRKLLTSPKTKVCTRCGKRKPQERFRPGRGGCRACDASYARIYRADRHDCPKYRAKKRKLDAAYRAANREVLKANARAAWARRMADPSERAKRRAECAKWRAANPEKGREYYARWKQRVSPEKLQQKSRKDWARVKSDPRKYADRLARAAAWYKANPDKKRAAAREWYAKNSDWVLLRNSLNRDINGGY